MYLGSKLPMMKEFYLFLCLMASSLFAYAQTAYRGYSPSATTKQQEVEKSFLEAVDFARFKGHLKNITEHPHVAGTAANEKVRDYLVETSQKAGWKAVRYPYDVYLPAGPGESGLQPGQPIRHTLHPPGLIPG